MRYDYLSDIKSSIHLLNDFKSTHGCIKILKAVTNHSNGLSEIDIPGPLTYRYVRAKTISRPTDHGNYLARSKVCTFK